MAVTVFYLVSASTDKAIGAAAQYNRHSKARGGITTGHEAMANATFGMTNSTLAASATDLTLINILTYCASPNQKRSSNRLAYPIPCSHLCALAGFLCIVTFGIGSAVHLGDLRIVWVDRKIGFVIGLSTQYLLMPALARLISKEVLGMPDVDALGLILIGCCPGGATSNAFAYFAKGDMALSVSMTAVSNFLAFGTLPLLLFLWTRGLNVGNGVDAGQIPFLDIFGSLCMVLVPAAFGVALRHRSEKWAARAEKLGAVSGAVLIISSTFAGLIQNSATISDATLVPWKNVVGVALVAPAGMAFAALAVWLFQLPACTAAIGRKPGWLPYPSMVTIVLETGIQNTVLAIAIVTLMTRTWSAGAAFRLQLIPILWGICVSAEAVVIMFVFRYFLTREQRRQALVSNPSREEEVKEAAA